MCSQVDAIAHRYLDVTQNGDRLFILSSSNDLWVQFGVSQIIHLSSCFINLTTCFHSEQLLDLDHKKLTDRANGRNFRFADVYGKVVHDIIA